jgi:hypothetical protein
VLAVAGAANTLNPEMIEIMNSVANRIWHLLRFNSGPPSRAAHQGNLSRSCTDLLWTQELGNPILKPAHQRVKRGCDTRIILRESHLPEKGLGTIQSSMFSGEALIDFALLRTDLTRSPILFMMHVNKLARKKPRLLIREEY